MDEGQSTKVRLGDRVYIAVSALIGLALAWCGIEVATDTPFLVGKYIVLASFFWGIIAGWIHLLILALICARKIVSWRYLTLITIFQFMILVLSQIALIKYTGGV